MLVGMGCISYPAMWNIWIWMWMWGFERGKLDRGDILRGYDGFGGGGCRWVASRL